LNPSTVQTESTSDEDADSDDGDDGAIEDEDGRTSLALKKSTAPFRTRCINMSDNRN
jgi:hypothetical protein